MTFHKKTRKRQKSTPKGLSTREGPVRQRRTRFVTEFLKDFNATRAAKAAGYSAHSAGVQGSALLADPEVQAEIEAKNAALNKKLEVTVERVREELAKLAFHDPRDYFDVEGNLKPIHELEPHQAAAIAGIDFTELFGGSGEDRNAVGMLKKIKLADKGLNLERLGRHLKMFTDKVEVTTDQELLLKLQEGRKRAAAKNRKK